MIANLGKYLIIIGLIIAGIGLFLIFRDKLPFLKNVGRLPGDIYIKRDNISFYFPLMTSIILSIVLSLIFWIFSRFR